MQSSLKLPVMKVRLMELVLSLLYPLSYSIAMTYFILQDSPYSLF